MRLLERLRHVESLQEFPADELRQLAEAMDVREFPDGHVFCREGGAADAFYVVLEGEVEVERRDRRTRERNLSKRMGAGNVFGLVALVDRGPRTATCTARGQVTVAVLPLDVYAVLVRTHRGLAHRFQRLVARQLARDVRTLYEALARRLVVRQTGAGDDVDEGVLY